MVFDTPFFSNTPSGNCPLIILVGQGPIEIRRYGPLHNFPWGEPLPPEGGGGLGYVEM